MNNNVMNKNVMNNNEKGVEQGKILGNTNHFEFGQKKRHAERRLRKREKMNR